MPLNGSKKTTSREHVHRNSGDASGGPTDFVDARTIEEAARAINHINARTKRIARTAQDSMREDFARRKITLSPTLDAWLKKEIAE